MSNYSENLGFTPSTNEENVSKLRKSVEKNTKFTYNSDDEFLATNMHLLFEGFSTIKMEQENKTVEIVEAFFKWIKDAGQTLQDNNSTFNGFLKIIQEVFPRSSIINKEIAITNSWTSTDYISANPPAGVCFICICSDPDYNNLDKEYSDQEVLPDLTFEQINKLKELIKKYYPTAGIVSYDENAPNKPPQSINVDVGTNYPYTFYFIVSSVRNLSVELSYRVLDGAIPPNNKEEVLKKTFLDKFNSTQYSGSKISYRNYLTSCNLEWVEYVDFGWLKEGETTYIYEDFIHKNYHELTKIMVKDGDYDISLKEITN